MPKVRKLLLGLEKAKYLLLRKGKTFRINTIVSTNKYDRNHSFLEKKNHSFIKNDLNYVLPQLKIAIKILK